MPLRVKARAQGKRVILVLASRLHVSYFRLHVQLSLLDSSGGMPLCKSSDGWLFASKKRATLRHTHTLYLMNGRLRDGSPRSLFRFFGSARGLLSLCFCNTRTREIRIYERFCRGRTNPSSCDTPEVPLASGVRSQYSSFSHFRVR